MVDGSGTIDPANLSNSGTFCAPTLVGRKSSVLSLAFAHPQHFFCPNSARLIYARFRTVGPLYLVVNPSPQPSSAFVLSPSLSN